MSIDAGAKLKQTLCLLIAILLACPLLGCAKKIDYTPVTPGRELTFPRDHFAHNDFRTEWWYYTGHLFAEDGNAYGFELVFFRQRTMGLYRFGIPVWWVADPAHVSHFAISDEAAGEFHFDESIGLRRPNRGGSRDDTLLVWSENWRVEGIGDTMHLMANMRDGAYSIDIVLGPQKPPVLHGDHGFSQKGDGGTASYYVSVTRFDVQGYLFKDGRPLKVDHGMAWMDHEVFSGSLPKNLSGWDWFSLQLDDGSDIMAFLLHRKDGEIDSHSSGTMVSKEGKAEHFDNDGFTIEELRHWDSEDTWGTYPVKWRMRIPKYDADLEIEAVMDDQELLVPMTAVDYWEGAVMVKGTVAGKPVNGRGYVEMSGRAEDFQAF